MKYPGLDLSDVHHVSEWMERSYGDDIGDKTNIYTMLISNKGYRGLTHPVYEKEVRLPTHKFSLFFVYCYHPQGDHKTKQSFVFSCFLL